MTQQVQGVVARSKGAPVELVEINIPDPGPNDVVVRIQACGVCHTDLTYRDGGINDDFPFLLGHEAAGIVESAGTAVTHVEVGDFVVLNWRAVCGRCRACRRGRPLVLLRHLQRQPADDAGRRHGADLCARHAFADKTLVHERQCTRVDPNADPAVVGLLGCGVMAGLGAGMNTGNVSRGDSVAVIGCAGWATRRSPGPGWPARHRSSPSTATRKSCSGQRNWAPPTRSTPRRPIRWRRCRNSPVGSAPTSSSTRWAVRKRGSRPCTLAIWPALSCWSACPLRS